MLHNQKPDEGTTIVAFSKEEAHACNQVMQLKGELATSATCYSFNELPADVKGNLIIATPVIKQDETQNFTQAIEALNRITPDKPLMKISFRSEEYDDYVALLSPQPTKKETYLIEDYISGDSDRSRLLEDVCEAKGIGERARVVEPEKMMSFKYELGAMLEQANLEKIALKSGFTRDEKLSDNVKAVLTKDNKTLVMWRDEKGIYQYQNVSNQRKGTALDFVQNYLPSQQITKEDFKGHRLIASKESSRAVQRFVDAQQPGKGTAQEQPRARGLQM